MKAKIRISTGLQMWNIIPLMYLERIISSAKMNEKDKDDEMTGGREKKQHFFAIPLYKA